MATTASATTGANVRAEMARRGISQMALADAIHLSQPGLSKRLRGVTAFDVNEITAIATFLGVPLSSLVPETVAA